MTSSTGSLHHLLAARLFGGCLCGFVWGTLRGLGDSFAVLEALQIGLFAMVAGLLAALVGHFLYLSPTSPDVGRSMIYWAIIGVVFIGVSYSITPPACTVSVASGSLSGALIGAAGGGATGGLVAKLVRVNPQARKAR
jgi:hypothetical protein